jgi:hypothetical protein
MQEALQHGLKGLFAMSPALPSDNPEEAKKLRMTSALQDARTRILERKHADDPYQHCLATRVME